MASHVDCLIQHGITEKEYPDLYEAAKEADMDFDSIGSFEEVENRLLNKKRVKQLETIFEEEAVNLYHQSTSDSEVEPIMAMVVKDVDDSAGYLSLDSMSTGTQRHYFSRIPETLQEFKKNILGRSTNKATQEDLIWELSKVNSGNAVAKKLAKELSTTFEEMRVRLNKAGHSIKFLEDWMLPQSHDITKISNATAEKWASDLVDGGLLDVGRMGYAGKEQELIQYLEKKVFRKIVDQDHIDGGEFSKKSLRRFMHFKGPEEWIKYQKAYGSEDIFGTIIAHITKTSNDIAIAERFGPNPEKAFKRVRKIHLKRFNYSDTAREADAKAALIFDEAINGKKIANQKLHKGVSTFKHMINTALLKKTAVLTPTDLGYGLGEAQFLGMKGFRVVRSMMKGWIPGNDKDIRAALRLSGNVDAYISSNMASMRFGDLEGGHRIAREVAEFSARINGLEYFTGAHRRGFDIEFSSFMGEGLRYGFDNEQTLRAFKSVGVDEELLAKWKTGLVNENGIDRIDISKIKDTNAASKYGAFASDAQAYAVPGGGTRARHALGSGGDGTKWGELGSLMMQYKTFPITMYNTHLMRMVKSKAMTIRGRYLYASTVLASTTGLGILAYEAKQFANKGEIPEWDSKTVAHGLMEGGGLGPYGDVVISALTGRSNVASMLAGPAAGLVDRAGSIVGSVARGDVEKAGVKSIKLAKTMAPGNIMTEWFFNRMLDDGIDVKFTTTKTGNIMTEWFFNRMLGDGIDNTSDNGIYK